MTVWILSLNTNPPTHTAHPTQPQAEGAAANTAHQGITWQLHDTHPGHPDDEGDTAP